MTKQRVRELTRNGNGADQITFSSKITLELLPFPAGLYESISIEAFRRFPEPVPPKKTITVLGGTEEVDDKDNPEYQAEVKKIERERTGLLLEAMIELCPQIDLSLYEREIKRLEKYSSKFPDDPDERRLEFLTRYVMRTSGDYGNLFMKVVEKLLIDDPEVVERINYFQRNVEGAITAKLDASGTAQGERVEVPQASQGT